MTSKLAFVDAEHYAAVGMGASVARGWLERLYERVPIAYAIKLAAYVVYQAKASVGSCGLGTDIMILKRGMFQVVSPAVIRQWEDVFRTYPKLERNLFHYCIGVETEQVLARTHLGKDDLVQELDEVRKALTRLDL